MTDRVIDLGSEARLVTFVGEVATVEVPRPHPVGARVVLREGAGTAATGKVVEASRRGDTFRVRVRLFSPSAAVRAALAARLAGDPNQGPSQEGR